MQLRRTVLPLLASAALLAGVAVATTPVPNDVPAQPGVVTSVRTHNEVVTWDRYNAAGKRIGTKSWRRTDAGGDCCEVYGHTTQAGRIYEFGGTYLFFSDDRGVTWKQVTYALPPGVLPNGEGAVTVAPNGDIVGITWDPYSGDVLTGYKYTAATKKFETAFTPLHGPFFDRPWVSIVKGPITIGGKTVPYATLVRGAYPSKDVEYLSADGLHYDVLTVPPVDSAGDNAESATYYVPVKKDATADWNQDVPAAHATTLNAGGALHYRKADDLDAPGCEVTLMRTSDATWHCVKAPASLRGTVVRQDSRGWLTQAYPSTDGKGWRVEISTDGGRHWSGVTVKSPVGGTIEGWLPTSDAVNTSNPLHDLKVNGKLGKAALITRFDKVKGKPGQDMVFLIDVSKGKPRLVETDLVGDGNLVTANDAVSGASGDRMDYMTIAFLPDGKLVASFDDKAGKGSPQLAIAV
ncbi:MAG: hypothetical protein QOK42_2627 [Frankiaceae bacterium]|nr:hypothetical protein [Frankiaceae bacterium]